MIPKWRRTWDAHQAKRRQAGTTVSSPPKTETGSLEPESTAHGTKEAGYPEPTVQPPHGTHTHTAIILHGRGDTGPNFGFLFLASTTSNGLSLPEALPGFKFVFPTAKRRRIASINRAMSSQWFDIWSLRDPSIRQEDQYDGIHESSVVLHDLIKQEAALVGLDHIVLGGLSQGMAMGLHVMLNFTAETPAGENGPPARLAGFFGMSGWLPCAGTMLKICFEEEGHKLPDGIYGENHPNDQPNPVGAKEASGQVSKSDASADSSTTSDDNEAKGAAAASGGAPDLVIEFGDEANLVPSTPAHAAFALARDIASLPPVSLARSQPPPFVPTPVFLGHGTIDNKVAYRLGEEARDFFTALGCTVQWRGYEGLGHWYRVPEEIDDIVRFVQGVTAEEES